MDVSPYFVETRVEINAPRALVWNVLTDFAQYPNWGRFIKAIHGRPEVNSEIVEILQFRFLPKPIPGKSFLIRVEPPLNLTWRGSFVHSFDRFGQGTHSFTLTEITDQRTLLVHREDYRGLLVPAFMGLIHRIARPHFEMMDEDLKARSESLFSEASRSRG